MYKVDRFSTVKESTRTTHAHQLHANLGPLSC